MIASTFFSDHRRECLAEEIEQVPNAPAVFLVHAQEGTPYLARTALLKRRLQRLIRDRGDRPSRLLNLMGVARNIEYWLCGSRLESSIVLYALARHYFSEQYLKIIKLRMPAYVKLTLANQFPRTQITSRLTGGKALYFGPFRTRAGAELFDSQSLDLFQIRRCQENLEPRPDHPGCIYGEMGMCLRPCQEVVGPEEYAAETERFEHFLSSGGVSLLESVAAARERCSEDLDFEQAAKQHKRYERIQQVLGLRDELVQDPERMYGVAITPSILAETVTLWFMSNGQWMDPIDFPLAAPGAEILSMDRRLRDTIEAVKPGSLPIADRQEHLALLAKWYYSSWRDGEWIGFESLEKAPYRRVVNAISRVAKTGAPSQ